MYVIGNFLGALASILDIALTLYLYVIIARAILSWVSPDPYNPIVQFIHRLTEPVLHRIRRFMPDLGGIDLSPIIVFFIIMLLQRTVVDSLRTFAMSLR